MIGNSNPKLLPCDDVTNTQERDTRDICSISTHTGRAYPFGAHDKARFSWAATIRLNTNPESSAEIPGMKRQAMPLDAGPMFAGR